MISTAISMNKKTNTTQRNKIVTHKKKENDFALLREKRLNCERALLRFETKLVCIDATQFAEILAIVLLKKRIEFRHKLFVHLLFNRK